jgi:uncharacterized protein YoxC
VDDATVDVRGAESEEPTVDDRMIANAQGALGVVRATSATVDDQLEVIAGRTGAQASDAKTVVDDVSGLSSTIEEIAATAAEVSECSERAAAQAVTGRASAQEAIDVMHDVRSVSAEVATEVEALQQQIDRIATALAGIDDIADQTNLLALNASIEAARAGSEGDGFAVVADEVKSLAADVQRQAEEIDTVLDEVQAVTDGTVGRLETAVDEIDQGTVEVEGTLSSLETIAETVEETAAGTQAVSEATDQQAETTETVVERVESVAERAVAIEADVTTIDNARAEQTEMLGEIHGALESASAARVERLAAGDRIPTGLDDRRVGGLLVGGRSVLQHDGAAAVDALIAQLCAAALESGRCVSLSVPPSLSRGTLADVLAAHGHALDDALREDRLFVLDAFGGWRGDHNVFDLGRESLAAANRATNDRRDRPLLVVGNVAGEIAVMGESAAREARYANDEGLLRDDDTVLNVIDTETVSDRFGAFYTGAADQVLKTYRDGETQYLELVETPSGDAGASYRLRTTDRPPSVRLADDGPSASTGRN